MNHWSPKTDPYAMAAPLYDFLTAPFLKTARKAIIRAASSRKCTRILDVACGTGEQAVMLAKAGFEVNAVDLSPAMLAVARRKSPAAVTYLHANAQNMPFQSSCFDGVTISLALHEMERRVSIGVAREILRVLTPGGSLIVLDYAALNDRDSGLGLSLMGLVEKVAGRDHFRNFVRFIRNGGIEQFLQPFELKTISSNTTLLGAARIVVLEKSGMKR
jgi:demethylmenaquinone methyltransferase/2-methoxy-6-polyprenyl-1,4-benzoquinol methylase